MLLFFSSQEGPWSLGLMASPQRFCLNWFKKVVWPWHSPWKLQGFPICLIPLCFGQLTSHTSHASSFPGPLYFPKPTSSKQTCRAGSTSQKGTPSALHSASWTYRGSSRHLSGEDTVASVGPQEAKTQEGMGFFPVPSLDPRVKKNVERHSPYIIP